ncbi:hypothetical protein HID58_008785, partial [Brassica napus]
MVLSHAASDSDVSVHSTFASRYVRTSLPRFRMPENSIPKEAAYQIINDELMLDGNPRLNLASFVTTWMEPECDKLIMASINKNYVDMDEYPVTTELQNRCVNMIAHLFNAPLGETETAVGVGTVGSSEAIMLAGLAFKRKWQNKRKAEGKPFDKPNIVTGANVQVCWEKFARYFEVELKEVKLREGYYVMDPEQAVEMVDENTICVAAILGSTLNGEFEDVKLLNDLLVLKNKETGLDIPIHVDAASGGFIAPFLYPELEWDFRLPQVKSINVSGHKYGLVYAGIGWVVWRNKEDLPDELIFHINYLGADQPTFTLNFSKGSSQVIAQYYQLIRLGHEGYRNVMENCRENMIVLREGLEKTGRFSIVSKDEGIPLVAFSLKDNSSHTEFEISEMLRRYGWIVPAYTMPANAEHITVLRVVIREDFSRTLAERLVMDIEKVMHELDELPSRVIHKISLGEVKSEDNGDNMVVTVKKSDIEKPIEIINVFLHFLQSHSAIHHFPRSHSLSHHRLVLFLSLSLIAVMVLSHAASDSDVSVHSTFASRYVRTSLPRFKMPENSIPKEAAYQIINDELMLDGNPRLNLASFVTTWMEPECDKLIMASINKNYVDMDEYPVTTELQNRCVNMIAHLFNAPLGETETAVGVGTVGSSEAIMLAGLAFKRKWQNKRKAEGKPFDKPNIVTGANVQVCWEKFARYFEVELKEVKLSEGYYVMDPEQAVEMVDENTICVAAILGSTLNGEFEDVKLLNDLLVLKNKETGWDTPIHVDAASGGFIAPFLYPELEWDFRLPLVKSINVSGHKYGLVYAGIGWVVWRNKEDLPEELIFHINYLGADQPTFTLNFSKGSSQVIAQYYQLIRLGHEGYRNVMENCRENMIVLREGLEKTGRFNIVSKEEGVPLVAFSLKDSSSHTEFEISDMLRRYGWIVPAYTMPPNAQHITVLRVVIREDFSRTLAERLVIDIEKVMRELDELPSRVIHKISLEEEKSEANGDNLMVTVKKTDMEKQREIINGWKKFVSDRKKTNVPAYTMPPNAQHITVLRVVIREDFSRTLAERLVIDIEKVMRELDELPSRVIHKILLGEEKSEADGDNLMVTVKKSDMEKQREIINGWKRFSDRKKR